ncbi:MAG: metallophosphoesterase [Chloroflexota bacterium]|nr:MAG: metallophosphoesterase [Chloroflexota bacterium]
MKPRLTIFFATDIHGSERVFRKFLNAASFYGADAVIFGGDITGKSLVPVVEVRPGRFEARLFGRTHAVAEGTELDDLEDRIRTNGFYPYRTTPDEVAILADPAHLRAAFTRVMAETAERWVTLADEKLRAAGIPALMMPGNDDEPMVKDLLAQGDWIIDAEGRRVELEGFQVISYGYSTTTPWHSPREVTEQGMAAALDDLAAQLVDGQPVIFNLHDPPYGSGLDLALKLTDDLRVESGGGQPLVEPVGSTAVRAAIERVQPVLSLHGHIHESKATGRIGRTTIVNPGSTYGEGTLQGVLITLEKGTVIGHQFVSG